MKTQFIFFLLFLQPHFAIAQLQYIYDGPQRFSSTVTDGETVFAVDGNTSSLFTFSTAGGDITRSPIFSRDGGRIKQSSRVLDANATIEDGFVTLNGTYQGLSGVDATSVGRHLSVDSLNFPGFESISLTDPFPLSTGVVVTNSPDQVSIGAFGTSNYLDTSGVTRTAIRYSESQEVGDAGDLTIQVGMFNSLVSLPIGGEPIDVLVHEERAGSVDLHGKGSVALADGTLIASGRRGGMTSFATDGTMVNPIFGTLGQGPSQFHPIVVGGRLYGDGHLTFAPANGNRPGLTLNSYIYSAELDGSDVRFFGINGGNSLATAQLASDGVHLFGSHATQLYAMDLQDSSITNLLDGLVKAITVSDTMVFGILSEDDTDRLFRIGKDGSDFAVIHDFGYLSEDGAADLIYDTQDGKLLGVHDTSLFQIEDDGSNFIVVDEERFRDDLVIVGRTMYGSAANSRNGTKYYAFDLDYSVGPSVGDCNDDGTVDFSDLNCVCHELSPSLTTVLTTLNLLQGDTDADGEVGFSDFLNLSGNFGEASNYIDGDLDCDGQVAMGDFMILSKNFGQSTNENLATVPEPNGSAIWLLVCLLARSRRRHRSRVTTTIS